MIEFALSVFLTPYNKHDMAICLRAGYIASMMITRRQILAGLITSAASVSGQALAQDRGLPRAVQQAVERYSGAEVVSVRIRRGAPTAQGFMYEVVLSGPGTRQRIVYVDPDRGRVLFETER